MTVRELFEFVTDSNITEDNIEAYLEESMKVAAERSMEDVTEQEKVDEEVRLCWNFVTTIRLQYVLLLSASCHSFVLCLCLYCCSILY